MRLTPEALGAAWGVLARAASALEGPAWLVGGAVRDALLGRPAADLDLALPGQSVATARRLADRLGGAFVALGEPHGVARVVVPPEAPGARPVVLDLADFRGPDLEADLRARDLTIHALAIPLEALAHGAAPVLDPTAGLADLAAGRLRACAPGAFEADPVRVLRLARLAEALGFAIEPETEARARAAAGRLGAVAAERVREELTRLLALERSAPALRRLDAWSALRTVLPEIEPMAATAQSPPHRFPVWEHSLRALEALEALLGDLALLRPHDARVRDHLAAALGSGLTRREVLKVAVLLHDVAKPETRTVDPDGRVRFLGHDRLGAERAEAVARRLRWPTRAALVLGRLVRHHLRPAHLGALPAVSRRAYYRFFRDLGEEVPDLVCLTIADAAGTDGRPPAAVYRGATRRFLATLLAGPAPEAVPAPPLVRGTDVMALLGIPPGPEVGRWLEAVREARAVGEVRTREEALAWLRARAARGPAPEPEVPPAG